MTTDTFLGCDLLVTDLDVHLGATLTIGNGATLTVESCSSIDNDAVDPGETVTVSPCVENTGSGSATGVPSSEAS